MASIHHLEIVSDLIRSGLICPELTRDLFRTVDESISYEIDVASGVTDADLPGFGSGDTQITTIQTFVLFTDTTLVLNWNGADSSLVVASGDAWAAFIVYGVSTTTVPHVTNSQAGTATVVVMAGGT